MTDMLTRLTEAFGADGSHWSCLGRDGERKFRALLSLARTVQDENYGTIIEIGTYQGAGACLLADYARRVITFDVKDWPLREQVIQLFCKQEPIEFRHVNFSRQEDANAVLALALSKLDFDLAFIDGNHEYESVRDNFNAVKHCGRVIFHDYKHNTWHTDRTVRFVDSIPDGRTTKLEPFALWEKWPNE